MSDFKFMKNIEDKGVIIPKEKEQAYRPKIPSYSNAVKKLTKIKFKK